MPKTGETLIAEIAGRVKKISMAALKDLPIESMSYSLGLEQSILTVLQDRNPNCPAAIPFCQQLLAQIPVSSTDLENLDKTVAAQNFVQQVYNLTVEFAVIMRNRSAVEALLKQPLPPAVKTGGFIAAIVAAADWDNPELASRLIQRCDSVAVKKEALKQVAQLDINLLENPNAERKMQVCLSILKDLVNSFDYEQELSAREITELRVYAQPYAKDYLERNVLKPLAVDLTLLALAERAKQLSFSDGSVSLYTSIQTTSTDPQSAHSDVRGAFFADSESSSEDEVDAFNPVPPSPKSSSSPR